MGRRLRVSLPGAIYHVMIRGNNKQPIFHCDEEREFFCSLLEEGVEKYNFRVLAFCLMTNHVHLAIQLNEVSLSKIFHELASRYTKYFNHRHKRVGHLFQGRFRSILVIGSIYLKKLIRYIHLNPVRAEMVEDPHQYLWSSHRCYLDQEQKKWVSSKEGIQLFGDSQAKAIKTYNNFLHKGINEKEEIDFERGIKFGIIADSNYFETIQPSYIDKRIDSSFKRLDFNALIKIIAEHYEMEIEELTELGRNRIDSRIRSVLGYLARSIDGISLREMAKFCNRSISSFSELISRFEASLANSKSLQKEVEIIWDKLHQCK